ncbi:MAG TPA: AFG1/ZapE family ATPase, partial [Gammaproteobacteria bacterium]|nr:AFG1/ZapE family ATPase [Gammaproteobacteria bacterium]
MSGPLARYEAQVEAGAIEADAAQKLIAQEFERLYVALSKADRKAHGWRTLLSGWQKKQNAPVRGIYLWGTVGRGKTFLMDQ